MTRASAFLSQTREWPTRTSKPWEARSDGRTDFFTCRKVRWTWLCCDWLEILVPNYKLEEDTLRVHERAVRLWCINRLSDRFNRTSHSFYLPCSNAHQRVGELPPGDRSRGLLTGGGCRRRWRARRSARRPSRRPASPRPRESSPGQKKTNGTNAREREKEDKEGIAETAHTKVWECCQANTTNGKDITVLRRGAGHSNTLHDVVRPGSKMVLGEEG